MGNRLANELRAFLISIPFLFAFLPGCGEGGPAATGGASASPKPAVTTTAPAAMSRKAILERLRQKVAKVDFNHAPLASALKWVEVSARVKLDVAWDTLRAAGVTPETPVDIHLIDVSVRTVLLTILDDAGQQVALTYATTGGAIRISTKADPTLPVIEREYDIRALLASNPEANAASPIVTRGEIVAQLIKLVTRTIDKDSWKPEGKVGEISEKAGRLIVKQTEENQEALAHLLGQLYEAKAIRIRCSVDMIVLNPAHERVTAQWATKAGIPYLDPNSPFAMLDSNQAQQFVAHVKGLAGAEHTAWKTELYNGQDREIPRDAMPKSLAVPSSEGWKGDLFKLQALAGADWRYVMVTIYPMGIAFTTIDLGGVKATPTTYMSCLPTVTIVDLDQTFSMPDGAFALLAFPESKLLPVPKPAGGTQPAGNSDRVLYLLLNAKIRISDGTEMRYFPGLDSPEK